MQLGMIGLGRMGGNMAKRIAAAGHEVVGYDRSPESDRTVASLKELVAALKAPRLVWVMVPAGEATDSTINELAELLQPGDMIIDGGNSRYTDDARHAAELEPKGIHFMDCGVSGGVWGIDRGYALMVGGNKDDFETARPIFEALKPEGDSGLVLAGPVGGGHFAKMVHNGIEYGMMQAFGEGFATMVKSDLVEDPAAVMSSWRDGSVVQSWLLDLLAIAFKSDPTLKSMPPVANESGEAKWMIEAALELGVPTPATAAALYARQTSRGGADDILRVVSTMRAQFGGHVTKIDGAIGGLIVLAITPFVLRFATLNDTAMHYLKYMLLINTYYIMGAAVNTALIAGVFRAGGDTKFGLICDTIDMWCYAIPLGFFAAFVLKLPVLWVYFLLCTDEFVKWPWVIKHYREGKWAKNITREEV